MYFYGSIQRFDYIDNKSDIDVLIFTDNMDSTISLLQQFLNNNKKYYKKVYNKMVNQKKIYKGYKVFYSNSMIKLEISIYNINDKEDLIQDALNIIYLPTIYVLMLYILKVLNKQLGILPNEKYKYLKEYLINNCYKKINSSNFFIKV